jgi:hypothetical protein
MSYKEAGEILHFSYSNMAHPESHKCEASGSVSMQYMRTHVSPGVPDMGVRPRFLSTVSILSILIAVSLL